MTDVLITITHEDYKVASEAFHCQVSYMHGVGVSGERYKPVTIEEKLALRGKMGYPRNAKILLCIGELNDNKNQVMAIRMMHKVVAKYPEAILLLAGNGPKQKFLEQLIKQEGLERNVKMIGYVTNLQDYQHIIDVQVSCSLREGLPLNIVESMLSGNPVVAGLNRGHRELIQDGINGYIVEPNDYESMGTRVLNLLDNDDLRKQIVQNAMIFAQDFTFTSVKKNWKKSILENNNIMMNLMYITKHPVIAQIAEEAGVDWIFVDMEFIGKDVRQSGLDTVQNHHTVDDVRSIKVAVKKAKVLVRVNPIHDTMPDYVSSEDEINGVIEAGADIIMLPFLKQ